MPENTQHTADASYIASVLRGLLQYEAKVMASLPAELAQLRSRLDETHTGDRPGRCANYELFYRIGCVLYGKDSLTMGELSSALSVPLSTATGMVDLLVRNGHVQRLPDPDDRRIVKVALTDSGREMHRTVGRYVGERFQKVLSGLSDEEQKMLLAIIRKMESAMKDLAD